MGNCLNISRYKKLAHTVSISKIIPNMYNIGVVYKNYTQYVYFLDFLKSLYDVGIK